MQNLKQVTAMCKRNLNLTYTLAIAYSRPYFMIFVYIIGSCIFNIVAAVKLWWCLIKGDVQLAESIALQYDDTANVALNGDADVKISTRIWLNHYNEPGEIKNQLWLLFVNTLFFIIRGEVGHCYNSFLYDLSKNNVKDPRENTQDSHS